MPHEGVLASLPVWTMIPSRSTSPAVSPSCRGWRRSRSAGRGPRGRIGRTAIGTSRSTTEGASTRRRCATSAGRARSSRSEAGARAYSTAGPGWRSTVASPTFTTATWTSLTAKSRPSREGRFDIEPLLFHLAGVPSYLVLAELAVKRVLHGESAHARVPGRRCGNGRRGSGGAGPSGRSATLARTTLRMVVSPSAPGSSRRRRRRRRMRYWPRAASGSPTRSSCSPGPACARSMTCSPPRARDPAVLVTS